MRSTQYPAVARPLRQRTSRSAMLRLAFRAALVVVLILVVSVIGAAVVVLASPTEFSFVRDRIAATLASSLGAGYTVAIDRAVVDVDPVLGLVVRVDNIDISDNRQAVVAHIPSTRFAVNPLSLLRLRVDLREVELSGAELSFVRTADGKVLLGDADTVGDAALAAKSAASTPVTGGFPDLFGALTILDRGMEPPIDAAAAAGFERFAMVNGTVNVWDAERQQVRRFPNTDLSVAVNRASHALAVNFSTSGFGGRWTATVDRDIEATTQGHALSVVFSQLTIADLLPALAEPGAAVTADIPLYGRATMDFDREGKLLAASARLDLGAGVIRFGRKPDSIVLDEATLRVHWDPKAGGLIVDPSPFFFGQTRGTVTGAVQPVGNPSEGRYSFAFDAPGAILASVDSGEPPMVAQRMSVSGVADLKNRLVTVDNGIIAGQDASVAAAGSIGFDGESPSLAMAAQFSPMTVTQLKQMWIPLIASDARDWVNDHVFTGRIVKGEFQASVPAGMMWNGKSVRLPDDAMRLDLTLADTGLTTFGSLPPITKAAGHVVMAGSTFGVDFDTGEIVVPSGPVHVDAGAFAISNLAARPADGQIELQLSGSAVGLAEIADSDPLNALKRNKLSPADLSGNATAAISVKMPMRDGLTEADIDWRVTLGTRNLASRAPIENRTFSDANVTMTVKPDGVTIYGKAKIDGVAADLSMGLPLSLAGTQKPGDRQVRMVLDDQARKRLGVGLDQVISGTVGALITDLVGGGSHYDLDLQRARLTLDGLGWSKGIGVPGTLAFDLVPAPDGYTVANLALKGDGFGFTGSAKLDKGYNLISADIDHMSLRKGDSIAIKLVRGRNGYGINARGTAFDLRGLMVHFRDKYEQSGGFPDLALDAKIDHVVGFNNEVVNNVSLNLVSVGGVTQKVAFSGALGDSHVGVDYAVTPKGITLNGQATDLGRFLRFTDLYQRVAGGAVSLTGQADPGGPLLGTLDLTNFDVLNEPAIQQAINSNSEPTATPYDRVHFTRMLAHFRAADRALAIEDAVLRGPQLGASFSGRYDARTTDVTVIGTYIPLFPLNNLFGQIPIIGLALGAGPREGLIGVTFKVEGPVSEPHVFINPLSAVAPGIFRKIFDFQ